MVAPPDLLAVGEGPSCMPTDARVPKTHSLAADSAGRQKLAKKDASLLQSVKKTNKIIRSLDPIGETAEKNIEDS